GEAEPDPAVAAFERSLAARPDFEAARLNLALFNFQRQRLQAALDGYRAVLGQNGDHPIAWNGVGLVLMELKRFSDARNAFARAVEADPQCAPAHYNLGFALSQLGAFDEALRETRRALELDPFYVPQKFSLSIELQFKESLVPIAPALVADVPTPSVGEDFDFDPAVLDGLFGELAPSETARQAVPADPFALARDLLAKGLLESATAEVHLALRRGGATATGIALLGEIYARRGLHGEALERFRQAKESAAEAPDVLRGEAAALLALGRAEEARPVADQLVRAEPSSPDPLELRAKIRLSLGDLHGAQDDVLGALAVAPGRADLLVLRGRIGRRLGDTDEALTALEAALALDPGHVQAWYEAGLVREERRELVEARAAYEQALAVLPTFVDAGLALGELLRRQGRPAESTRLLVELLLLEPYALEALVLLGRSLADERRHRDAVTAFNRVLKFVPDHALARFHRGLSLNALGQFAEAIEDWDQVVGLNPTGPLAAAARAEARSTRDLVHILQPVEV
ncbi:MAG: tetratricopeptide repeat protein, partial [Gemmatimonadetes bacterium]|nr:tetratricopeptide repeat protein [Gemmatimonadota bacterium]